MGFLGWIIFVLGLIGAPILDIATIHVSFFDKRPSYNFWLTHTNAIYVVGNSLIVRVAGFFDEPGTFAYYITFALILNKTYGFGRKLEILLFLAGFPTLSLAYFISTLLYLILFYLNLKNIRYFAILTLTLILLTNYIHANRDASDVNAQIYDKTLGRFSLTQSDGKIIEGDNRSQLFNNGFEAFQDAPIIGHGVHYQKNPKSKYRNIYFGANLMAPFATYGIVGVAFLWLHFYFWSYLIFIYFPKSKVKKIFIFSWLIVAINLLQRPDLIGLLNYFLVLLLIDSTLRSKKMLEKKINET
jgi:hypothetical protein